MRYIYLAVAFTLALVLLVVMTVGVVLMLSVVALYLLDVVQRAW